MLALRFELSDVVDLAEHAHAAPSHQAYGGAPAVPALIWVKDDGTYLMSNGRPALLDPATGKPHRTVHADGYGPGTENQLRHTEVGGDNFAQTIQLTHNDARGNGPTLLDILRLHHRRGDRWLVLQVARDDFGLAFAR